MRVVVGIKESQFDQGQSGVHELVHSGHLELVVLEECLCKSGKCNITLFFIALHELHQIFVAKSHLGEKQGL